MGRLRPLNFPTGYRLPITDTLALSLRVRADDYYVHLYTLRVFTMATPLVIIAAVFAVVSLLFLVAGVRALKRKRLFGSAMHVGAGLLLLSLGALSAVISVSTQGYRALTREEVAAVVSAELTGEQTFRVIVRLPEGGLKIFELNGDELYVDARILKWKPWVNVLGMHTAYQLDRVSGRYIDIEDEREKPRTIFPLAAERRMDLFELRRRFPLLAPLVDAKYGSATFIPVEDAVTFEVRVSTSGLLIRAAR